MLFYPPAQELETNEGHYVQDRNPFFQGSAAPILTLAAGFSRTARPDSLIEKPIFIVLPVSSCARNLSLSTVRSSVQEVSGLLSPLGL